MTQIRKEIKDFVKKYNQCIDWNRDILDKLNIEPKQSKHLFKDYLLTTIKLNKDTCDLKYAKVYPNENGIIEMQAYSFITYESTYFWVNTNLTEEEYKKDKLIRISNFIDKHLSEIFEKINNLNLEKSEFLSIKEELEKL